VGPALVDEIAILRGDERFEGDPYSYYMQHRKKDVELHGLWIDRVLGGMLLPAGNSKAVLGARKAPELAHDILDTFELVGRDDRPPANRAVIEIVYSSIYGERWRIRSDSLVPQGL
jgi:hypothetical protein